MRPANLPANSAHQLFDCGSIELRLTLGHLLLKFVEKGHDSNPWSAPTTTLVQQISESKIQKSVWTHVCGRWSAIDGLEIFINGQPATVGPECGPTINRTTHHSIRPDGLRQKSAELGAPIQIQIGQGIKGVIHDCHIWSKALSLLEIRQMCEKRNSVPGDSLDHLLLSAPLAESCAEDDSCVALIDWHPASSGRQSLRLVAVSSDACRWIEGEIHRENDIQRQQPHLQSHYASIPLPRTVVWETRRVTYSQIMINGSQTTAALVIPGSKVLLTVKFNSKWDYNDRCYCPGCIVQVYIGMGSRFSCGIIEHGIHSHKSEISCEFIAPTEPGEYLITQRISLDYQFVWGVHNSCLDDAIARIIVHPPVWTENLPFLVDKRCKRVLATILMMSATDPLDRRPRHPETGWHLLPIELIQDIFALTIDCAPAPALAPSNAAAESTDESEEEEPEETAGCRIA